MKAIIFTIGVFALLTTFSSCTSEEVESTQESKTIIKPHPSAITAKEGDIDPPVLPTKP